jgi:hypothetical protein
MMDESCQTKGVTREHADTCDQPTQSPDGVDLTLIRWMLSLTPAERLDVLQQHLQAIASLRDANPDL